MSSAPFSNPSVALENYFQPEEFAFICGLDARFPDKKIVERFNALLSIASKDRPNYARAEQEKLDRAGWVRTGSKPGECETVAQHSDEMISMLEHDMKVTGQELTISKQMAHDHDIAEPIVGDFTPFDDISKKDKNKLERLAITAIFEDYPERLALWDEAEFGHTRPAQLVKDVDKVQMYLEAWRGVDTFPKRLEHIQGVEKLAQENGFKTSEGVAVFEDIKARYKDGRVTLGLDS